MSRRNRPLKSAPSASDLKPVQPYVVAVPVSSGESKGVHTVPVNASNAASAIELAKQNLVKKQVIATQTDIRFVSKAVQVTAKVGDKMGEGRIRAAHTARHLVLLATP